MSLGKIKGLGGKLGAALTESFGAQTAGEVQAVGLDALSRVCGDKTRWVAVLYGGSMGVGILPHEIVLLGL